MLLNMQHVAKLFVKFGKIFLNIKIILIQNIQKNCVSAKQHVAKQIKIK